MANKTVDGYSALTSPATDDYVLIWDTSAGATKKIAYSYFDVDLATTIQGYTALASPADDDLIAVYDDSAGTMKKVTVDAFEYDLVNEINSALTMALPASNDKFPVLDVSAGTIKAMPYSTLSGNVKADGSEELTADWDIGASRYISGEKFRARSAAGLRLEDDAGNLGVFIEDSTGYVAIGTATVSGTAQLTVDGSIRGSYDTDETFYFGRAAIGYDSYTSDGACFSHVDNATGAFLSEKYALRQVSSGETRVNSRSGEDVVICEGGSPLFRSSWISTGVFYPNSDSLYDLGRSAAKWNDIYAANGTIQTSDERMKEQIDDSDLGLDFVNRLRPVRYQWRSTEKQKRVRPHYGLIAQEVKTVLNEMSVEDFAGYIHDSGADAYGLRYTEFIAPLIKAVQELTTRLDALEATHGQ